MKKLVSILLTLAVAVSLCLVTAVPVAAQPGTNYYVNAVGGSDGNTADLAKDLLTPWATIQHAVETVPAGSTINVAAGTYTEQLIIDRSLTLQAASTPTIDVSGYTTGNGITITANNVTIDGFNIIGIRMNESGTDEEVYYADADANKWQTINVGGSDTSGGVSNIEVTNCDFVVNSGDKGHIAMFVHDSCSNVSFTDNTVTGYLRGIYAHASEATPVNNLTVDDNHFDMVSFQRDDMSLWGVTFNYTVSSAITLNTGENFVVTDNVFNGPGTFPERGADPGGICNVYAMADFISHFTTSPTTDYVVDFSRNQITNFYLGMCTMGAGGYMADNDIDRNLIGIQIGQQSATWATGETEAVSITGNDITDNKVGIDVQNFVADGIAAHYNNIAGNTDYGVQNSDIDVFDATCNWWDDASGPSGGVADPVTGTLANGTGDAVSSNVHFDPWLSSPWFPMIEKAKLDFKKSPEHGKVSVKGKLNLCGDGFVAISDEVIVTLDSLSSETITMVEKGKKGDKWEYKRPKDGPGIIKHMTIDWNKGKFDFRMDKVNLGSVTNPVTIRVEVGDDFAEQTILMREKKHHWDYKAPRH